MGKSSLSPFFCLIPVAAALLTYAAAAHNGFVWDDPLVLRQLRAIHGVGDLLVVPPEIPRLYYRPLVFASYLLDRALGGESPFWFHASVIAVHALGSALVFMLAFVLFGAGGDADRRPGEPLLFALVAGVLFAVHPAHVESVAWMAGRSDVLAGALLLAAILLFAGEGEVRPWFAAACWLLALLAKEAAVLGIALFPLLDWTLGRRWRWRRAVPLLVALLLYVALRQLGVGMIGEPVSPQWGSPLGVLEALGFYCLKMLLPLRQSVFVEAVPDSTALAVLGGAAILAFAALLVWSIRRSDRVVVFALGWIAATLAPALILVLRHIATAAVAERYLYIPSVGAVVLVAWGAAELCRRRPGLRTALLSALALLVVTGMWSSARRSRTWSNDLYFWASAAASSPAALPQRELADAYLRRGDLGAAESAYRIALERPGSIEDRVMTLTNLGNLYRRRDRVDAAVEAFRKAAELRPHPLIYHDLGLALMRQAELAQKAGDQAAVVRAVEAAREALQRALDLGARTADPALYRGWEPAKTHILLGQVLQSLGRREEARRQFEEGIRLDPQSRVADLARQSLQQLGP